MAEIQKHIYVLILAGGGGTRLWPMSREKTPKQFIKLFKGKSLFELTLERAKNITSNDKIYLSTTVKYHSQVKKEAKGIPEENIICEPIRRDTALAQGLAALYIYKRDPDGIIINLASDHLISPTETFVKDMKFAAQVASETGLVVTMGIKPLYPHIGLGHIKAVKHVPHYDGRVLVGEKFVEKPPLNIAEKYTKSGQYYWNANHYVWRADTLINGLQKYAPKTSAMFPKILSAIGTEKENEVIQLAFQMAPTISIDFALSEKLKKFICIPASYSWTDVGYWDVVWENLPKDNLGNVIEGPHGIGRYIGINSKNNLLFLDKKIVATIGLENMLIIDTPDALLICPKDQAQGVKQVVQALKDNNLTEYL